MSKTQIVTGGIADDAVSEEHIDATAITGSTALAATPADTDELLISDAGTLKRIDFSHIKAIAGTEVDSWRISSDFTNSASPISNWERVDTSFDKIGTGLTHSSGIFTFPSTGKYYVSAWISGDLDGSSRYNQLALQHTPDNSSYTTRAISDSLVIQVSSAGGSWNVSLNYFLDIQDTSNDKIKFLFSTANSSVRVFGNTNTSYSGFTCIKLGAT